MRTPSSTPHSKSVDEPPCDPAELIRLFHSGDIQALDRATRCHGDQLLAVGRRFCGNATDAEDAVQDALISAGTNLKRFRGDGSVQGWLVRMVVNACHRMRRGQKNNAFAHDAEAVLTSPDASPEERAMLGELVGALGTALHQLSPTDRAIVLMAEADDWTGPEIAEELQLSAGAVRVRLTRARKRMREQMSDRMTALP